MLRSLQRQGNSRYEQVQALHWTSFLSPFSEALDLNVRNKVCPTPKEVVYFNMKREKGRSELLFPSPTPWNKIESLNIFAWRLSKITGWTWYMVGHWNHWKPGTFTPQNALFWPSVPKNCFKIQEITKIIQKGQGNCQKVLVSGQGLVWETTLIGSNGSHAYDAGYATRT
jgi:hypothetical protein